MNAVKTLHPPIYVFIVPPSFQVHRLKKRVIASISLQSVLLQSLRGLKTTYIGFSFSIFEISNAGTGPPASGHIALNLSAQLRSEWVKFGSESTLSLRPTVRVNPVPMGFLPVLRSLITFCLGSSHRSAADTSEHPEGRAPPGLCSYAQTTSCCLGWRNVNGVCQRESAAFG